jgi:hypothetical protein
MTRRPPTRFPFADPVPGGDGEKEADDGGCGGEQADLQAACAEACGIHVEKVDGGAAQHAKPGDIEVEVPEVGAVFFGDIRLSKRLKRIAKDYINLVYIPNATHGVNIIAHSLTTPTW